jgi:hypothetical protein
MRHMEQTPGFRFHDSRSCGVLYGSSSYSTVTNTSCSKVAACLADTYIKTHVRPGPSTHYLETITDREWPENKILVSESE